MLGELLVYPFFLPKRLRRSTECEWRLTYFNGESETTLEGVLPVAGLEVEDVFISLGYTSFVPAQRHSAGYRSQGPMLELDIDRLLEHEIEMWLQSNPVFSGREIALANLRQEIRESRDIEPPVFAKRRNLMTSGPYLLSDTAVVQKIVDLDYASYRLNRPTMRSIIDKTVAVASEITEGFSMHSLE